MKRMLALMFVFCLVAAPALAQGSTQDVQQAKADLQAAGVNLQGACGALKITNLVAWRLRPAYGLLHKAGGSRAILKADGSCLTGEQSNDPEGYAADYLIYGRTGVGFDLLSDAGGNNGPQWAGPEDGPDMVSRNFANYREPVDPSAYLAVFVPPPVVTPPPPVYVPPVVGTPPLPAIDLTPILTQGAIDHAAEMALLQELRTQIALIKSEAEEFQSQVRSKYVAVMDSPIVRYGLAAISGWLVTRTVSK